MCRIMRLPCTGGLRRLILRLLETSAAEREGGRVMRPGHTIPSASASGGRRCGAASAKGHAGNTLEARPDGPPPPVCRSSPSYL